MSEIHSQIVDGIHFKAAPWPPAPALPTLVFIHGSGGSTALWRHQMGAFAGAANTLALDLPGHGQSPGPGHDTVTGYARGVAALIRRLGPPMPVPCGLSIGGAIVLQLLLDAPDAVAAGILTNTGARLKVLPAIFEMIASDYDGFIDQIQSLGAAAGTDPARLEPLLADSRACPSAVTAGDFRACDRFDVMARLGDIRRPVLVVSADEDRLTPPKYADYLEAHIPGARRARIPAAGHLSPLEQPASLNAAIRAFLSEAAPFPNGR